MSDPISATTLLYADSAALGFGAMNSYNQASAARGDALYAAQLKDLQAEDARVRGEAEATKQYGKGQRAIASQRAVLAGRGLDVNVGTAGAVQDATDLFSRIDAATIRENAARESAGYRNDAAGQRARADSINPLMEGFGTLLGGAGQVAGRWYDRQSVTKGKR